MEKTKRAKRNPFSGFLHLWRTNPLFSTGMALLVMVILQTIAISVNSTFSSPGDWIAKWVSNWLNILRGNAGIGIIALGMAFVIISGGIDLSVGSLYVAAGAFCLMLLDTGSVGLFGKIGLTGVPAILLAVILTVLFATLLGECNGLLVSYGKLPPFIATLGAMQIFRSVTQYAMKGQNVSLPSEFLQISQVSVGGQRIMPILYWAVAVVVMYVISKHTAFGRHVFAVGSNERTTSLSGVNVKSVKRRVYALIGLLVGVASVLQLSRIGSLDYASGGSGYEMDAIAAVVVGGTSMSGGKGSIIGTVFGTLIVAVMNNLLILIGVDPYLSSAFKGAIIIGAVLLQRKDRI